MHRLEKGDILVALRSECPWGGGAGRGGVGTEGLAEGSYSEESCELSAADGTLLGLEFEGRCTVGTRGEVSAWEDECVLCLGETHNALLAWLQVLAGGARL